ncbi:hypothetical protein [Arenicella xantha]|uniref:Uncharacterized protein n=1 Tax=Arenicella xantha TaxID=644221 RepID=A0A395JND9_9GAMM|nr:hypothetical protein [Arenicella xantha]RBP52997.1 hypothetical protein DFR28_101381 [Arenicella xantha]
MKTNLNNSSNELSSLEEYQLQKMNFMGMRLRYFEQLQPRLKRYISAACGKPNADKIHSWIRSEKPIIHLTFSINGMVSSAESIYILNRFYERLNQSIGPTKDGCTRLYAFSSDLLLDQSLSRTNFSSSTNIEAIFCDPDSIFTNPELIKSLIRDALIWAINEMKTWKGFVDDTEIINLTIADIPMNQAFKTRHFDLRTSVEFDCIGFPSNGGIRFSRAISD